MQKICGETAGISKNSLVGTLVSQGPTVFAKFMCTPMFIAALFKMAKTWKQPKCPSIEDWIKMWPIYTTECYSATGKDEIAPFATTWMDLENITLSEIGQSEKDKNHMIALMCGIENGNSWAQRAVWWLPEGRGEGGLTYGDGRSDFGGGLTEQYTGLVT
uniref:DUF1725 domain-containing protein n=1 Tax=Myotis myotis TaxID=51298 RepID=A0A7J7VIC2_MYOMY|nr:hypothetical protein mMyoMyo1_008364 [Myotis myotis]